jgi:hypothetical protein
MKLKRWAVVVILSAFVATVAGYTIQGAWAQQTSNLQLAVSTSDPQLLAKGVGVSVPVNVTCSGANQVTYFVGRLDLLQRINKTSVAEGGVEFGYYADNYLLPVCDGQTHTYAVKTVIPQSSVIFKKGSALVTGYGYLCAITDTSNPDYPTSDCVRTDISQEVRIR